MGTKFRRSRVYGLLRRNVVRIYDQLDVQRWLYAPSDKPGLGIDFDEKLAAKYPYNPAYLPVARLEDGTLWNW